MTREQLWDIIGNIDDRFIAEAAQYDPKQRSRSPERIGVMSKKRLITFALAAALILALGVTAYAIGMGIHRQRQAEMRESFGMEGSCAPAYEEYDVPEENTSGVTLLSAINNGGSQRIIVNVAPVTRDDLALTQHPVMFSINGGQTWEQAMTAGDENSAYDAESQTLTVSVMFGTDGKQPGEEITVLFNINGSLDLGSLVVKITDPDTRLVQLSEPIVLTYPVTEKPVTLIGMELRGNQAIWMLETEDAAYFYGDHSSDSEADAKLRQDNIVTWINWLDEQFRATKLYFADGSSCSFNGHEFSDVDGNLVRPHVDYDRLAIDVSQVVSIEMNGQTYKIR